MTAELRGLRNGSRVLVSDVPIAASNAQVREGLLLRGSGMPVYVAVKVDVQRRELGNHVEQERRFYERVERAADARLQVPRYHGSYRSHGATGMVLERAQSSLDRLANVRTDDRLIWSLLVELSGLAAASLVGTLRALRENAELGKLDVVAHGDIRLDNLLLVDRGGVLDVMVADWGFVHTTRARDRSSVLPAWAIPPEQRGAGTDRVPVDIETDLWYTAVALWQLMHQGATPFRSAAGEPFLAASDPLLSDSSAPLIIDTDSCDETCLFGPENEGDPVHDLAAFLLHGDAAAREREKFADQMWPALLERRDGFRARQRSGTEHEIIPLSDRLAYANALIRPRPRFTDPPPVEEFIPRKKNEGTGAPIKSTVNPAPRLMTMVGVLGAASGVAIGITTGLIAFWASRVQLLPLPDAAVDAAQPAWVAAVLGAVALVLAVALGIVRGRRGRLFRRNVQWGSVALAAAAAVTAHVVVGGVVFQVWPWSGDRVWMLTATAAVSAAATALLPLEPLTAPVRSVRTPHRRAGAIAATAISLGLATVSIAGISVPAVAAGLNDHARPVTVERSIAGMPEGLPAFFNPHDIAVSDDGTVALVEGFNERDSIWIFPPNNSKPYLAFTSYSSPAQGIVEPQPSTPIEAAARLLTARPTGDLVTGVVAIDFLDNTTLVILGPDGISRLALNGTGTATASRITEQLTADRAQRFGGAELIVDDGSIYVQGATSVLGVPTLPYCATTGYTQSGETPIWQVTGSTAVPFAWEDGACLQYVTQLLSYDGGAGIYGRLWRDGENHSYVARIDGSELEEVPGNPADQYLQDPVLSGERLLGTVRRCTVGFPLEDDEPMPVISEDVVNDDAYCADEISGRLAPVDAIADAATPPPEVDTADPETDADTKDACEPPQGNAALVSYDWQINPKTTGPDGTIYMASDSARRCSSAIWKLLAGGTDWNPAFGTVAQPEAPDDWHQGDTTTMSAQDPMVVGGALSWGSREYGYLTEGGDGSEFGGGSRQIIYPVKRIQLNGTKVILATRSVPVPGTTTDETTTSGVLYIVSDAGTSWFLVPGATDLAPVGDKRALVSRCNQLFSFDPVDPAFHGSGELDMAALPITILAGANEPVSTECAGQSMPATPVRTGLVGSLLAPTSAAGVEVCPPVAKGEQPDPALCRTTYVYAEAGSFAGAPVSRIRIIDVAEDSVSTLGYSASDPPGSPVTGDLAPLGLVATDIAVDQSGRIAITTMTPSRVGPVILFDSTGRHVIDPGAGVEASGVAWLGNDLVVTDMARGDVLVLAIG